MVTEATAPQNKAHLPSFVLTYTTYLPYNYLIKTQGLTMNCNEFKRWLAKQGCTFDSSRGKGGHITVMYKGLKTVMPFHGSKEMREGTRKAILKQLGIKE
jgi:mRNA interferase HicA